MSKILAGFVPLTFLFLLALGDPAGAGATRAAGFHGSDPTDVSAQRRYRRYRPAVVRRVHVGGYYSPWRPWLAPPYYGPPPLWPAYTSYWGAWRRPYYGGPEPYGYFWW